MLNMINEFDRRLFFMVTRVTQASNFRKYAKYVSASGNGHLYFLIAALLWVFHPKGQTVFWLLLSSFLIELPLYWLLKNSIRRIRPCDVFRNLSLDFQPSDKFSLPSGHTAAAFVMATTLCVMIPVLGVLCLIWAITIGGSRIVLSVHYPLDVLAGAFLGWGSVMLVSS